MQHPGTIFTSGSCVLEVGEKAEISSHMFDAGAKGGLDIIGCGLAGPCSQGFPPSLRTPLKEYAHADDSLLRTSLVNNRDASSRTRNHYMRDQLIQLSRNTPFELVGRHLPRLGQLLMLRYADKDAELAD